MPRLGLGTVQWGMSYGIANQSGIATSRAVSEMLARAREAGVNILDTAWAYGEAERVLGEQGVLAAGFRVVTKTRPLKGLNNSASELAEVVETAFRASLVSLVGTSVYALLVHHADDLLGPAGDALWARLQSLRAEGLATKIGCSLYHPEQFDRLLQRYPLELVQIPYNIYDQRYVVSGMAAHAKALGVEIHVRSAFLQGVLLMPPERLPDYFAALREHHAALWSKYANLGLSPLQAALGFCLACPEVDEVIVGCEQPAQWNQILAVADTPFPSASREDLGRFAVNDEAYINPSRWGR